MKVSVPEIGNTQYRVLGIEVFGIDLGIDQYRKQYPIPKCPSIPNTGQYPNTENTDQYPIPVNTQYRKYRSIPNTGQYPIPKIPINTQYRKKPNTEKYRKIPGIADL